MKKAISIILSALFMLSAFSTVYAAENETNTAKITGFTVYEGLYAHAVANSDDGEAWQQWQCEHDEDFNQIDSNTKYFFLPSSANNENVEIFNGYNQSIKINDTEIQSQSSVNFNYNTNTKYSVTKGSSKYNLYFMKSTAEAAIYVNNSNADGNGTELMTYLNSDKSLEATATGAIVDANGNINNTAVKKIKGRGNTTWGKSKKPYNITYADSVSIAGMNKAKKYSLLANYQDDSLSRNRFLYDLAKEVGTPYATSSRYVDLYSNGYYWGSYQLTEKIDVGKSSMINDITDKYIDADGNINPNFSFLCEVDASANDNDDYYVKTSSGNKITIKYPELNPEDVGYEEVKQYVKEKFDAFFNAVKSKTATLSDYADVDSVSKIYLINEIGKNWDAGVSSLYFTYKPDAEGNYKFFGSPVWDYDNSLGNANGSSKELSSIGVNDYTLPSGWWCKYKGKSTKDKSSSNIMNNIARNATVLKHSAQVWFDEFVPAVNKFSNNTSTSQYFYSSNTYYNSLVGSAEMNYKCGWLLNTGSWIADHTSLRNGTYNIATHQYVQDSKDTTYSNNFTGAYNYAADWFVSRCNWLSSEMFSSYEPKFIKGDVNLDGKVTIADCTEIQKYLSNRTTLSDVQLLAVDVNEDGKITISDATTIQKMLVNLAV